MTKKDQDFLKDLYLIYLFVMVCTGIILTNLFITIGYKVVYHMSPSGILIWIILSILLSPLVVYTKGMKQITEHFMLSSWRIILFFSLPVVISLILGMVVANQEKRENVSEYGIGISLISYQNTTFKPLTQEQTTLVAEKLDAAAEKAELIAEEGNRYYVFYKSTCPYCKVGLTSLLEKLPEERKKDLLFIDLDNTDAKKIADSFGVDKAGTVVSVVKDKETGNHKIMKDTIAFDDEEGDIVANNQLIDKMVAKEDV